MWLINGIGFPTVKFPQLRGRETSPLADYKNRKHTNNVFFMTGPNMRDLGAIPQAFDS